MNNSIKTISELEKISELYDTRRKVSFHTRETSKNWIIEYLFFAAFILAVIISVIWQYKSPNANDNLSDSSFQAQIVLFSLSFAVYTLISTLCTESFYGINVARYVLSLQQKFLTFNKYIIISVILMIMNLVSYNYGLKITYYSSLISTLILTFYFCFLVINLFGNLNKLHGEIRSYCMIEYIIKMKKNTRKTSQYLYDLFEDLSKSNLNEKYSNIEDDLYILRCLYGYFSVNILNLKNEELDILKNLHRWTADSIRFLYRNNNFKYAMILTRRCMSRYYSHSCKQLKNQIISNNIEEINDCFDFTDIILSLFKNLSDVNIWYELLDELLRDILLVYSGICEENVNKNYSAENLNEIFNITCEVIINNTSMTKIEKLYCLKKIFGSSNEKLENSPRHDGQSINEYRINTLFAECKHNIFYNKNNINYKKIKNILKNNTI